MARARILLDTGPWVALLSRSDSWHGWAVEQFAAHRGPFYSCEAVVAETCFLLARAGFDPAVALQFIERGVVQLPFSLQDQIGAVRQLFERYDNVPASLADASLIRLSELIDDAQLLTLDSDFRIYRRHSRRPIPLISP
jgi:predicted nucleic acid-binding protein